MNETKMKRGPYISLDGDEMWLPVSDYSYNEARSTASEFADEMQGPWGRSRYEGKMEATMHDHDDFELCEKCPSAPAWHFSLYEGTYRGR